MAYKITEDCIACGACAAQCPNNAISEGDTQYKIDSNKCTECVGFFDTPQCASGCPVEAPKPDEGHKESKDQLLAKFKKLNPGKTPK